MRMPSFEALLLRDALVREEVWDRYRRDLSWFPPVTLALIAACLLLHVAAVQLSADLGLLMAATGTLPRDVLFVLGGRHVDEVAAEPWRLASCLFVHGGPLHLGLNVLALYGLGRLCEALYGPARFLFLFLVSGLAGSVLSWAGGVSMSVGASSAVFGLLGAGVVFGLVQGRHLPSNLRRVFGRRLIPWVVLNLVIGLAPFLRIDNLGHLGGLLGGMVVAVVLGDRVIPWGRRFSGAGWAMLAFSVPVLAWAAFEVGHAYFALLGYADPT
ncbi:MAG TPA: rhomboid family intramembrane serine protease [Myxococcota bacterium]|nr:rhomboid family intramembrane serine protease [Myxococcota bacterium]